jgi:hypothetical protein|uniref:DUF551 domain-containing protein n=1 Tax=Siphoviridae sp. ctcMb1 TaxID=2827276 RepID=A0A8S5R5B6_9CAUD|nr:MAG TPA: Protein of unknown function (DUF551) [Siphoviridae sp. ctcMb1]
MTDKEIVRALRYCKFGVSCENCPAVGNEDCFDEVNTAAADLIERLTAENAALREKVPQWISVEEKLPADYIKRYLIAFKDAGGSIVDAARYIPGLGWECRNWEVPQGLITDWMPLPGAPEKGDKA